MKKLRNIFAETMVEIGSKDKKLVVMVGDISHGILKPFAKKFPSRYYNIGICESATVNMAAGLSKVGLIPVVHTITPFLIERAYEQIKLDFGYQNLDINLISVGGSFDYSKLGCSHHCYNDVSILSHFKRCSIILPGSENEFKVLFKQIYKKKNINYFRLPEHSHKIDFKKDQIKFGKSILVEKGGDITIAVIGSQLNNVIEAQRLLKKENINAEIIYFHTIKPFDSTSIYKSLKKTKKLLTVEELSAHDGLYNLCVKASLGINNLKVDQIAVKDFIHNYGSYQELCNSVGLTKENIFKKVKKLIKRK